MTELANTLDALAAFVHRFVVLSDLELSALAVWIFHTWAFEAADTTPYLSVSSAEKRSGKTRLLEVLELLVRAALPTANISDAALYRVIAQRRPTLLFDEVDAIFSPKARDREDMRGMLNAGYRVGSTVLRMGGGNMTRLEEFEVFCPKAFAGIGELPDTLRDRSVRIRLERRTREEPIDRFRRRQVEGQAEPLRQSCESMADHHLAWLTDARPELPEELDDRAQDYWEPLLAIADLAGAAWSERVRVAALALSTGDGREDESLTARLLADIRDVFETKGEDRFRTQELIDALAGFHDAPWGEWYGKPITAQTLAKLLKPHQIKTKEIWIAGSKARGYRREQFENAWRRVLGGRTGRCGRGEPTSQATPTIPTTPTTPHAADARIGDPMYPVLLAESGDGGHLTRDEFVNLLALHNLIEARRSRNGSADGVEA